MNLAIRPRCNDCAEPAHKALERAGDGKVEFYCNSCHFMKFNTQAPPRPLKEQLQQTARMWAVLGERR